MLQFESFVDPAPRHNLVRVRRSHREDQKHYYNSYGFSSQDSALSRKVHPWSVSNCRLWTVSLSIPHTIPLNPKWIG